MKQGMQRTQAASHQIKAWVLYLIAIICGAVLMSLEIVGGRLLSPFYGSSSYVWGSIISIFLIALSSGYYLGGLLADKKPKLSLLACLIAASGLLILFIPPMLLPVVKMAHAVGLGLYGSLVVSVILFFLPSLGLGVVSPFVVKLGLQEIDRLGNLVGKFYAVSTFGSIVGTLLTTFLFIPVFGVREVIYALGIILLLLAAVIMVSRRLFLQGAVILLSMCALLGFNLFLSPATADIPQNTTLIYKKESMYNNIKIIDQKGFRYMLFNEVYQSGMDLSVPNAHVWPYTRLMEEAASYYQPDPGNVLLIGLGGGTLPKSMLVNNLKVKIEAVDIDPYVVKAAYDFFAMPEDLRLTTAAADGRMYLQGKKKAYDVIMVDAFNRTGIPHHLVTKEFFEEMQAALKPGGLVVFNIISSIEGDYSLFLKSLLATSDQVFEQRRLFQTADTTPYQLTNLVLVVSQIALDSPGEISGYKEYKSSIDLSEALVLTDNYAPVEALAYKIMAKE